MMNTDKDFKKNLTAEEIKEYFREQIVKLNRPADEVPYTDKEFCKMLDVSPRLASQWRAQGLITFSQYKKKIYYMHSEILTFLNAHKVESILSKRKI